MTLTTGTRCRMTLTCARLFFPKKIQKKKKGGGRGHHWPCLDLELGVCPWRCWRRRPPLGGRGCSPSPAWRTTPTATLVRARFSYPFLPFLCCAAQHAIRPSGRPPWVYCFACLLWLTTNDRNGFVVEFEFSRLVC